MKQPCTSFMFIVTKLIMELCVHQGYITPFKFSTQACSSPKPNWLWCLLSLVKTVAWRKNCFNVSESSRKRESFSCKWVGKSLSEWKRTFRTKFYDRKCVCCVAATFNVTRTHKIENLLATISPRCIPLADII